MWMYLYVFVCMCIHLGPHKLLKEPEATLVNYCHISYPADGSTFFFIPTFTLNLRPSRIPHMHHIPQNPFPFHLHAHSFSSGHQHMYSSYKPPSFIQFTSSK